MENKIQRIEDIVLSIIWKEIYHYQSGLPDGFGLRRQ